MAVSLNNMKSILMLLESDEILDYSMTDDEGKTAKDTCPFNTPIYKLLMKH